MSIGGQEGMGDGDTDNNNDGAMLPMVMTLHT